MEHHQITSLNVPRETFEEVNRVMEREHDQLTRYLERLLWWNQRINLVSRDVSRETIWEHIRHSLLLTQLDLFRQSQSVVDAGTGGGLPGIPLAIAAPNKHYLLNDLVKKKVTAVRQMLIRLGLSHAKTADGSIKDLTLEPDCLLVSKHAFKINDLLSMTGALPWHAIALYKGENFEEELTGIDMPLSITSHQLSEGGSFYHGKTLLTIQRTPPPSF